MKRNKFSNYDEIHQIIINQRDYHQSPRVHSLLTFINYLEKDDKVHVKMNLALGQLVVAMSLVEA